MDTKGNESVGNFNCISFTVVGYRVIYSRPSIGIGYINYTIYFVFKLMFGLIQCEIDVD